MGIFINKLNISNYKCFENQDFIFNVPNGTEGSGLNILIGENGNGKTTVLEAINYLTLNSYSAENKLNINDYRDYTKEISIVGETTNFSCNSSIGFYKDWCFKSNGISFKAKSRDIKERGNLLSSPYQINNYFMAEENYIKKDGTQGNEIDSRDKIFTNSRIDNAEGINIFYFDKNRTRQITTGNYKTTIDKICDDLNWKFLKNIKPENKDALVQNIAGDYFNSVKDIADKSVGKKTVSELNEFYDNKNYENINIELLSTLHPFKNAFFALRNDADLKQINAKDLGSGVEIILTLLLLKNIASSSKGSIIYLIDEPELHLHPKAQGKLFELLLQESKNIQIIVSTHSPYLFKEAIRKNVKHLLFTRDGGNKIQIIDATKKGWGLFPWSPSWGEINYFAFNMPTIEFHDELYGYLHEKYIDSGRDQKEVDERSHQTNYEKCCLHATLETKRKWTPEYGGTPKKEENVTLPTFIRNKSHHPENRTMQDVHYTEDDMKEAIEELLSIIKALK